MAKKDDLLQTVAEAIGRRGDILDIEDPLRNVLDGMSPERAAVTALDAIPDGWLKVDGKWSHLPDKPEGG